MRVILHRRKEDPKKTRRELTFPDPCERRPTLLNLKRRPAGVAHWHQIGLLSMFPEARLRLRKQVIKGANFLPGGTTPGSMQKNLEPLAFGSLA